MPISCLRERTANIFFLIASLTLFAPKGAPAQSIAIVGSDETLEIATWNIEWFGNPNNGPGDDDFQRTSVRQVIETSQIDLWAVQEISDAVQFQLLLDELAPPWLGRLAPFSGQDQRIGYIYNTDTIHLAQVKEILGTYSSGYPPPDGSNYFAGRPPLQIEVNVMLPDSTVNLTFITLHMKCCSDPFSYDRRVKASQTLKIYSDYQLSLGEPLAAVLGDFNDELSDSIYGGQTTPYINFLNDPDDYRFLTLSLEQQNIPTYCPYSYSGASCTYGSNLDQILITKEFFPHYVDQSVGRLESVLTAIPNYTNSTSDHLPVYAVFSFPTSTGVAQSGEAPETFGLVEIFPNPVRQNLNVSFEAAQAGEVELSIFDMLGRRVHSSSVHASAARNQITIPVSGLANGLYLLRFASGTDSMQRTFVKGN